MNRLFTYGTLRQRGTHADLLGRVRSRQPGWVEGQLLHLPAGYPALIDGPGRVRGELVESDDLPQHLPLIDDYEGYDPASLETSLYQRVLRPVHGVSGSPQAWVYVMPPERVPEQVGAVRVSSGDWIAFVEGC